MSLASLGLHSNTADLELDTALLSTDSFAVRDEMNTPAVFEYDVAIPHRGSDRN